jgi:hypothetical protein
MGDVIDFQQGRSRKEREVEPSEKEGLTTSQKVLRKQKPSVTKSTYNLWDFSKQIDELVTHSIVHKGLPPEEVATILAHRLGTLVGVTERRDELLTFCVALLKRLNLPNDTSDEAG